MDPEKLLQYNPRLSTVTPAARVAYAKFKISKIKQEFAEEETEIGELSKEEAKPNSITGKPKADTQIDKSIVRPRPVSSRTKLKENVAFTINEKAPSEAKESHTKAGDAPKDSGYVLKSVEEKSIS